MQVKKYRAPDVKQALDKVKQELGPDALILETRKVRAKGLRGLFQPAMIEVTAVLESPPQQPFVVPLLQNDDGTKKELEKLKEMVKSLQAQTVLQSIKNDDNGRGGSSVEEPIRRIRSMLLDTGMQPDSADAIVQELIYEGLDLQRNADFSDDIKKVMKKWIRCGPIEVTEEKKPKVVFLVGTTGIGKTTTIAKLAAKYHLEEGFKVGLVTVDTYRIAAVEQLRTYAEIINIPIEVAYNKEEYVKALRRFADMDLVFVDTAGRSQQNLVQLSELREFVQIRKPDEVHLVVNASLRQESLKTILTAFLPIGVTHLIYSKIDEAANYGMLFDLLRTTGLPLSYITNGQRVPEDLKVPDADFVVDLILEG